MPLASGADINQPLPELIRDLLVSQPLVPAQLSDLLGKYPVRLGALLQRVSELVVDAGLSEAALRNLVVCQPYLYCALLFGVEVLHVLTSLVN